MQSLWKLTCFLTCVWAASILYGEMVAFWVPLWTCSWPPLLGGSTLNPNELVKVAVLADPQLMDRTSLRLAPNSVALETVQFYTDLYMRRSFHSSIMPFNPHLVLFLGDQFDGGPFLSDEEWQESLTRFKHIFDLNQQGRTKDVKVKYLSGNHDIGYTGFHSQHPEVISRYEKEFGTRNYRFAIGKVDFIVVDAQTLDGSLERNPTAQAWNFVQNVSMDGVSNPRVLLTHIPLYRSDGTSCGPYRSSPIINQRVSWARAGQGIMYQNYLSEETSRRLLDMIKPILVLSGHDHDQCTIVHHSSFGTVTEHTIGTLSWQQGNLYPSFMLLSATTVGSSNGSIRAEDAVATHLCFLPWQTHIYIWYLVLFVLTTFLLLVWPTNGLGSLEYYNRFTGFLERSMRNSFTTASKEKNEDENCEYEMIWDAEGSMHLVKKAIKKVPVTSYSDMGSNGRSDAVIRPTARKYAAQEPEASFTVEISGPAKLDDDLGKVAMSRLSNYKSRPAKLVIQRLFRVFKLLMTIAAVSVPLYMMLLFKDWIDL